MIGLPSIYIYIFPAGIMFAPYELTEDGYESHFATNYLGHFLLTHLLLNQLKAAGKEGRNSRIVNVSSIVHLVGRINYNDINGRYYGCIVGPFKFKIIGLFPFLFYQ